MSERPRAVVAGHGDYPKGIIDAVERITGRGALLIPVSGAGRSAADIAEAIRTTMLEHDVRVIFTDLQAGSCSMAARRMIQGVEGAVLVCGANLPTLLDFVLADGMSPEAAARRALERGREAMMMQGGKPAAPGGPGDGERSGSR